MLNDPTRRYDGFTSLPRGVDSGNAPDAIGRDQCAFSINVTFRGGKPSTRPPFAGLALTFENVTTQANFNTGKIQGGVIYEGLNKSYAIVARGGRLFRVDFAVNNRVSDISVKSVDGSGNVTYDLNADGEFAFLFQAEQFVIVFQGQHSPIIFDGSTSRRATVNEIPACYCGAYVNGRVWAVLPNRRDYIASDLVGNRESGTAAYNYRDSILKMTENDILNGGGSFSTPAKFGLITAVVGLAQLDTSLGQGPVAIFTENGVFTNQSPVDRESWADLQYPIQTQSLLDFGAMGARSTVPVNGDTWYRSTDGLRSWIMGKRNFNQGWANTPMSLEMQRVLRLDTEKLLEYSSAVVFDNRLLCTCTPHRTEYGIIHRGLAVLSFDQTSSMYEKDDPAWEGLWTTPLIACLMSGQIAKQRRAFAVVLGAAGSTEIHELLKDGIQDTRSTNVSNVITSSITRIPCVIETRQMDCTTPMELKRLRYAEIFVKDVMGQVDYDVKFRPDDHPCWVDWHDWTECNTVTPCEDACPNLAFYKPGYRPFMRTPEAPEVCDSVTGRLMQLGYTFQMRIAWTGKNTIGRLRMHANAMVDDSMGECRCNTTVCPSVTWYSAPQTAECPVGTTGDPVTLPAGYSTSLVSQADANALALAAAQDQLNCDWVH